MSYLRYPVGELVNGQVEYTPQAVHAETEYFYEDLFAGCRNVERDKKFLVAVVSGVPRMVAAEKLGMSRSVAAILIAKVGRKVMTSKKLRRRYLGLDAFTLICALENMRRERSEKNNEGRQRTLAAQWAAYERPAMPAEPDGFSFTEYASALSRKMKGEA